MGDIKLERFQHNGDLLGVREVVATHHYNDHGERVEVAVELHWMNIMAIHSYGRGETFEEAVTQALSSRN